MTEAEAPPKRLAGKVAVVTGATSGIGRATCTRLVAEGACVVFCGRRIEQGTAVARELGDRSHFVAADVRCEGDVRKVIEAALQCFGRLDILFNNAGGPAPPGEIGGIESIAFDEAVQVLLRSVFYGMKHASPVMQAQKSGVIISNASVAGHLGGYAISHIYSACKAAVVQLSRSVALELAPSGVRVNSVSPGAIVTGIFARSAGMDASSADKSTAAMEQLLQRAQPLPRAGQPEDVAAAVAFLASDDASFITGRDLVIDGGLIAGRRFADMKAGAEAVRRTVLAK
jgi:NAD(P)-dependent dehydrogenase (short-subunit alcohol dehydrogenase family)